MTNDSTSGGDAPVSIPDPQAGPTIHQRQKNWHFLLRTAWWLLLLPLALLFWTRSDLSGGKRIGGYAMASAAAVVFLALSLGNSESEDPQPVSSVRDATTTTSTVATTTSSTTTSSVPAPPVEVPPVAPASGTAPTGNALVEAPAPTAPVTAAPTTARPATTAKATTTAKPSTGVYYANCTEARSAGDTPLYRGDPGYRPQLDRDDDGVACE
jgi:hypothetical protein